MTDEMTFKLNEVCIYVNESKQLEGLLSFAHGEYTGFLLTYGGVAENAVSPLLLIEMLKRIAGLTGLVRDVRDSLNAAITIVREWEDGNV